MARGSTATDAQVVAKLLARGEARGRATELSPREREVGELHLPESEDDNRHVLAVLVYLNR
ncbi:hypothetical protein [Nonomuraea roseoviolacea]|uniref:Uncharacterized protein n=1 Tax=Nonomuraea roseoviolacea subsp. carminata TaxID=160689 RepID=A0ABT1JZY8_9ACTN|nr:hypothetical protein [Nonomuraea roseoviolacea]MCP2347300.1 hypothetical protein [Nonomuraea roseoviolacea subsp. carminata]